MTSTKDEAIDFIVEKGYWRIIDMGPNKRQGTTKVELCTADRQALVNIQQNFGGTIKPQDSIWRWWAGKAADIAQIALSLLPVAKALATEMHRYCQASGERRYLYVQGLKQKYNTKSIKISKFTDSALEEAPDE